MQQIHLKGPCGAVAKGSVPHGCLVNELTVVRMQRSKGVKQGFLRHFIDIPCPDTWLEEGVFLSVGTKVKFFLLNSEGFSKGGGKGGQGQGRSYG